MPDPGYDPGPIAWAPIEDFFEPSPGGAFEDLLARAVLDAPDLDRAIDAARVEATPTDPADTDDGDDQDLVDGAAELFAAAARVQELRPIDELNALYGLDPTIEDGARDVPNDDQAPAPVSDDELERGEHEWRDHGPRDGGDAGRDG